MIMRMIGAPGREQSNYQGGSRYDNCYDNNNDDDNVDYNDDNTDDDNDNDLQESSQIARG